MRIDRGSGLVRGGRYVASPNQDARPAGSEIELVVVHGITLPPGELGGPWIERLFTNRLDPEDHPYFAEIAHLRVSAHALIHRDGTLIQYVPFHRRAWHAGLSRWRGRERVNDFSVGIELEGTDESPYEDAQYERLAEVISALAEGYPGLRPGPGDRPGSRIDPGRIVGHSDIAPRRKTDPGPAFDWAKLRRLLGGRSEE